LTDRPARVLQVTESLNVEYGGLAVACAQLANHLARAGAPVTVATVDGGRPGERAPLDPAVHTVESAPSLPIRLRPSRALRDALEALDGSVVHVHGLWRLYLRQAAGFAQRRRLPLIVSVHGMLHEPALRQRGWRKKVVRRLGQDAILNRAAVLHATAIEEAEEIRRLGFSTPIAVIPWGVETPGPASSGSPADPRVVLFLGRFHPTKGLDVLLRSWARAATCFPSARLLLAGYDDGGFKEQFVTMARSLGISGSVSFEGPVEGASREQLFARASLLVLPSPSENFGFVVPEALIRGLPVITTKGAPWSSLVAERCGWWVPAGEDALAGALTDALGAPAADLRQMGERGRRFAGATFAWDRVTTAMLSLYAWTLGQAPQPSFICR
jgi:glycosyltransferase involved in cell wall biosynthesis